MPSGPRSGSMVGRNHELGGERGRRRLRSEPTISSQRSATKESCSASSPCRCPRTTRSNPASRAARSRPRVAGRVGAAERTPDGPAPRAADRAQSSAEAARRRPGSRASKARAEHPRRRPTATRGAAGAAAPGRAAGRPGSPEGQADARPAPGRHRRGARGPARPRARIYPPLLADQGLPAALEAQARKSAVPVSVEIDGIDRLPQDVEAAVYFSVLEALQNTAKYAEATHASIAVDRADGRLRFNVRDDGCGFDPPPPAAAVDSRASRTASAPSMVPSRSTSTLGHGTVVTGLIPIDGAARGVPA